MTMNEKYQPDTETLDAVRRFVVANQKVSFSYVQRNFKISFNEAAYLIDALEQENVVSPADNKGHRDVLVKPANKPERSLLACPFCGSNQVRESEEEYYTTIYAGSPCRKCDLEH